MNKILNLLSSILILLILLASVYAAGITEGSSASSTSSRNVKTENVTNASEASFPRVADTNRARIRAINGTCENYNVTKERIRCRLAEGPSYQPPKDNVPEACRRLTNPQACIALYKNTQNCYELSNGRAKDRCLKTAIGFTRAKLSEEREERVQKARNYLVALLYDLEERIESAFEQGEITEEESADLIEQIVTIKQAILDNKPKTEIQPLLHNFKQKYTEVFNNE